MTCAACAGTGHQPLPPQHNHTTIDDETGLALRIASWSCIRTTGSIPVSRCEAREAEGTCRLLPEWVARAIFGAAVEPFLASWAVRF